MAIVIPWVKTKLQSTETSKIVKDAVYAAQQLFWNQDGAARKEYAVKLATEQLNKLGIKIDEKQLSSLIEAAVQELHVARGDYGVKTD